MARKLLADMTLDTLEDEINFTVAALMADEDASDLVATTADWLSWIDEVRAFDRGVRQQVTQVDAGRVMANERLDKAVLDFADDLLADVDKDRGSARWLGFFKVAPTSFVRHPLADEVMSIQGWLEASSDPVLETHRTELSKRVGAAQSALVSTRGLPSKRSELHQRRDALAARLTAARDALHERLAERARERKLGRSWADAFFRVERVEKPKGKGATSSDASNKSAG